MSSIEIKSVTYDPELDEDEYDPNQPIEIVDYSQLFGDQIGTLSLAAGSTSGFTFSFGPYEMHTPPAQKDLFRHYVTSQWLHNSHIADEDPQYQCEAWIKSKPHLAEAWADHKIEIVHTDNDNIDYYYIGSPQEYCVWKIRWSEMFDA